ncbi:hypothetical protein [Salinibacter ruber]|jgi:hypothetical protein|uniref:hypothetical protein n=1 Tax=Salinibacter ruber TaxID=146919 RepID=UPI00207390D5|nr:hypothetical protein [Salinibacter ruber]
MQKEGAGPDDAHADGWGLDRCGGGRENGSVVGAGVPTPEPIGLHASQNGPNADT